MKKLTLIMLAILISLFSEAQSNTVPKVDTTSGKNAIYVPVYVFDKIDTMKVETMVYKGTDGNVKWCSPGWIIWKGRAVYNDKGQWQWAEEPKTTDGLDNKRKPVKTISY